jgi:hypothetical protein
MSEQIISNVELDRWEEVLSREVDSQTAPLLTGDVKRLLASHRALQRDRDEIKRKYDVISDSADYRQCCELREKAEQERDQLKRQVEELKNELQESRSRPWLERL